MLQGCRVLVVEDDFFVAHDLLEALDAAGAAVIGPAASVAEALDLATRGRRPDLALLDLNLRNETAHPLLAILRRDGVPCLLLTGDGRAAGDARLHGVPLMQKPALAEVVLARLQAVWHGSCRAGGGETQGDGT
jgi:DNA-binding response OmpR family regulator